MNNMCTKFHVTVCNGVKVIEWTSYHAYKVTEFYKMKCGKGKDFVLCIFSDDALLSPPFMQKSEGTQYTAFRGSVLPSHRPHPLLI